MVLSATNQAPPAGTSEFERTYSKVVPVGANGGAGIYMSHTEISDSEVSAFETQSILEALTTEKRGGVKNAGNAQVPVRT